MTVPTLYEWIGGSENLTKLTEEFYKRVRQDDILGVIFDSMDEKHPEHVAAFIGEVFGGPASYSKNHGGHPEMIRHHLDRHLTEVQRRRWINLLLDTYTDLDLPADPEFASSIMAYLEWGSRLAVVNSQPGAQVYEKSPMPKWGWGETGGPYQPTKK